MTNDGSALSPNPDRVSLAGVEVDRSVLDGPPGEAQDQDAPPSVALRAVIEEPDGIEGLPPRGWRVLQRSEDSVTFAAFDEERWHGWVLCTVEVREGQWRYRNSAYGVQPTPTRRQRGHGLRLEWTEPEYVCRSGEHPQLFLRLVNDRDERWIDDEGEYWGSATLAIAETGEQLPSTRGVAIGGTGRSYDLPPGGSVRLPVALAVDDAPDIAPGIYAVTATVVALGLESPRGRLRILE